MKATVRYDKEVDIMAIDTAPDIRIAVSSSVEDGLVADYGSEDGFDVVGIEFWAAGKHLAPFCALSEAEAVEARKAASKFSVKADYDKEFDTLKVTSRYEVAECSDVGGGITVFFGYWDDSCNPCKECCDMVGFELHNASECLAPYFQLNRAPLVSDQPGSGQAR